jgi:hypothetical protein
VRLPVRKTIALLVQLAIAGRSARQRLAELLWGGLDEVGNTFAPNVQGANAQGKYQLGTAPCAASSCNGHPTGIADGRPADERGAQPGGRLMQTRSLSPPGGLPCLDPGLPRRSSRSR